MGYDFLELEGRDFHFPGREGGMVAVRNIILYKKKYLSSGVHLFLSLAMSSKSSPDTATILANSSTTLGSGASALQTEQIKQSFLDGLFDLLY